MNGAQLTIAQWEEMWKNIITRRKATARRVRARQAAARQEHRKFPRAQANVDSVREVVVSGRKRGNAPGRGVGVVDEERDEEAHQEDGVGGVWPVGSTEAVRSERRRGGKLLEHELRDSVTLNAEHDGGISNTWNEITDAVKIGAERVDGRI